MKHKYETLHAKMKLPELSIKEAILTKVKMFVLKKHWLKQHLPDEC